MYAYILEWNWPAMFSVSIWGFGMNCLLKFFFFLFSKELYKVGVLINYILEVAVKLPELEVFIVEWFELWISFFEFLDLL